MQSSARIFRCFPIIIRSKPPRITRKTETLMNIPQVTCTTNYRLCSSDVLPPPAAEGQGKTQFSQKIQAIVDQISQLNLIEVSELNDCLKKTLNIQDAPMMAVGAMPAAGAAAAAAEPEEEEQPEKVVKMAYEVVLQGFDASKKVALIKEIKSLIEGMNLVKAKQFVEGTPALVKGDLTKEEAEELKKKLESVGAEVTVK